MYCGVPVSSSISSAEACETACLARTSTKIAIQEIQRDIFATMEHFLAAISSVLQIIKYCSAPSFSSAGKKNYDDVIR